MRAGELALVLGLFREGSSEPALRAADEAEYEGDEGDVDVSRGEEAEPELEPDQDRRCLSLK